MNKLKKGDEVVVLSGRDKGKKGKLLRFGKKGRVVVAGVHQVKRHQKPNPTTNVPGGIITKEGTIHHSNVAILNPDNNKGARVAIQRTDNGNKVRVFVRTGKLVDD